jgi:DNA repair exonuclease SbcCD ATPase subunit
MIENLIEQAFNQYGLLGLLVTFLVLGPGFTYVRTKNTRLQTESKAQEILNEFLREERDHAEQLEKNLKDTLARLEGEKEEVFQLQLKLAQTEFELEKMGELLQRIQALTERVSELEEQIKCLATENEQLKVENSSKQQQIEFFEQGQTLDLEGNKKEV